MEKKYNLLEKIHSLELEPAIRSGAITSLKEIDLFEFLTKDGNFFLKYADVNQHIPISRYFYKHVRQYISDQIMGDD